MAIAIDRYNFSLLTCQIVKAIFTVHLMVSKHPKSTVVKQAENPKIKINKRWAPKAPVLRHHKNDWKSNIVILYYLSHKQCSDI